MNMWSIMYMYAKVFGVEAARRALTPPEAWVRTVCAKTGADPEKAIAERDEAHTRLSVLAMENAGLRLSIPPEGVIRDASRYRTLSRLAESFKGATGATFWEIQPLQGETFEGAVDNAEIATKGGDDDGR